MNLRDLKQALLFGVILWLVPFLLAFIIFPIRQDDRVFFESIMPVTLAVTTAILGVKYFMKTEKVAAEEGFILGLTWMAISLLIDYPMFSYGPMKMDYSMYWKDIGFVYLIIPAITTGLSYVCASRLVKENNIEAKKLKKKISK